MNLTRLVRGKVKALKCEFAHIPMLMNGSIYCAVERTLTATLHNPTPTAIWFGKN